MTIYRAYEAHMEILIIIIWAWHVLQMTFCWKSDDNYKSLFRPRHLITGPDIPHSITAPNVVIRFFNCTQTIVRANVYLSLTSPYHMPFPIPLGQRMSRIVLTIIPTLVGKV